MIMLVFVYMVFGLALIPSLLPVPPFVPFGMGMFTLGYCILEGCNFLLDYIGTV
jgi:hypothetical protein